MANKKAKIGTFDNVVEYDPTCPVETKQAFMKVFNLTSEEYDAQQARRKEREQVQENKYPALKDLVWVQNEEINEMYYADDKGNRLDRPLDMEAIKTQMLSELQELTKDDVILVNGEKQSRSALLLANLALVNQKK